MDRDGILTTLKEVAAEILSVDEDAVVEGAAFKDDLGADSLDLVELVIALEERLHVTIPEDELAQIGTVGQAVDLIAGKLSVGT